MEHTVKLASTILGSEALFFKQSTCIFLDHELNILGSELGLEFAQTLVENHTSHCLVHIVEYHDVAKAVDELRLESLLHLLEHVATTAATAVKSHTQSGMLSTGIACHYEHHVAEVGMAALVVGEARIVHHLQQDVVDVLVSLLYLVEQQHAVRSLAYGISEQAAILITHITRWRTNELGNGVLLGVLTHVEANQLNTKLPCQHSRHLGLAHAGWTHKEERRKRFAVINESCLRQLNGLNNLTHGLILTIDDRLDALLKSFELGIVVFFHGRSVNLHHLHEHIVDESLIHRLHFLVSGMDVTIGTGLVDEVDGLVGQEAPHNVLGASAHSIVNGC